MINWQMIEIAILTWLFFALVSAIVAYQARRRDYAFFPWWIAGILANLIFFLVLLAVMPDYARKARRRKYLAQLKAKLADRLERPPPTLPAAPAFVRESVVVAPDRSIGDLSTVEPLERSLGDEETHA